MKTPKSHSEINRPLKERYLITPDRLEIWRPEFKLRRNFNAQYQGIYLLSIKVNGHPTWILRKTRRAIWSKKVLKTKEWVFGSIEDIVSLDPEIAYVKQHFPIRGHHHQILNKTIILCFLVIVCGKRQYCNYGYTSSVKSRAKK